MTEGQVPTYSSLSFSETFSNALSSQEKKETIPQYNSLSTGNDSSSLFGQSTQDKTTYGNQNHSIPQTTSNPGPSSVGNQNENNQMFASPGSLGSLNGSLGNVDNTGTGVPQTFSNPLPSPVGVTGSGTGVPLMLRTPLPRPEVQSNPSPVGVTSSGPFGNQGNATPSVFGEPSASTGFSLPLGSSNSNYQSSPKISNQNENNPMFASTSSLGSVNGSLGNVDNTGFGGPQTSSNPLPSPVGVTSSGSFGNPVNSNPSHGSLGNAVNNLKNTSDGDNLELEEVFLLVGDVLNTMKAMNKRIEALENEVRNLKMKQPSSTTVLRSLRP
eukprot:TRINITY_DN500_c0_g1_i1.p1 TRINITY_DN500_c0_g1~~TRINITY_DN500_c0_g1_i1.p1  ORF type:complete len:327 (-),score=88.20 TRINITY_DN500_c0_g1_i1:4-984(-)